MDLLGVVESCALENDFATVFDKKIATLINKSRMQAQINFSEQMT